MSEKEIFVKKRSGSKEKFDLNKINKVVAWAIKDIENVSLSDIEINARFNYIDGITTKEIHDSLINACVNLITEKTPNYQYVASRLLNYQIRKTIWGGRSAPRLYDHIKTGIKEGFYTKEFFKWFSKREIDKINDYIEHNRDFNFTYSGIKQMCDKYLVQNRETGQIFETPQFAFMLIAMTSFHKYDGKRRMDYIKRSYDSFSQFKINLPTPLMAGARTNLRSFSSCCLVDVDDTMDSLMASASAIGHATAARYGIGFNIGRIRPKGASIRGGEVLHTGLIPFLKVYQSIVKSCQQAGLRGGSATCTIPIFHYEIEDVVVLKNNGGTDDNRVRSLDYSVSISRLFYDRFMKDENITLLCPHESKEVYDSFGLPEFDELYKKYEARDDLKFKKTVRARDLFQLMVKERVETGRIYILNIDHANEHSPWTEKINMSNLCVAPESLILTKDGYKVIKSLEDKEVEVWNGSQWSKTTIRKTGQNQKLIRVILKDGSFIDCTPYHKFYVDINGYIVGTEPCLPASKIEVRAYQLKSGDNLIKVNCFGEDDLYDILVSVQEVLDMGRHDDVYCCLEPIDNKIVINGILTGNCQEILHPLKPIQSLQDGRGEIGVCILSAINLLEIKNDKDLEENCDIAVRILDEIIDYQDYFCKAAENFAKKRRSLGIGITNLAALLAKNHLKYSDKESPNFVSGWMEKIQYFLLKSSVELAKEKGPCEKFGKTKYSKGILPIDTYRRKVDEVVTKLPAMDWEGLRDHIEKHGLRHSTLTAAMPCESSSVVQSSTNGIEPVRSLITYKKSKANTVPVVVPGLGVYDEFYEKAFDLKDNIGLINVLSAIQKWFDMSLSSNLYYNYSHYEGGQLPDTKVIKELIYAYNMGLKTLYYNNTDDGDKEQSLENGCESGACSI